MIDIEEFGITEGISELIFTTISKHGLPNAAPIGLHRKKEKLFSYIYNSHTFENIINTQKLVANITYDPILFVKCALSDIELENFEFENNFPILKNSNSWILFECRFKEKKNPLYIELFPLYGKIKDKKPHLINRGFNAVIESAVHATRFMVFGDEKYFKQIEYYNTIVNKCGGEREKEAMKILYNSLKT